MSKVIIYKSDNGGVVEVFPTPDILKTHTIEEVANKDVPAGKPYKIVNKSDLPSDDFRNAWEVDEATLTDGTGSEHDMFITDPQHPDYVAPEVEE